MRETREILLYTNKFQGTEQALAHMDMKVSIIAL